jgi:hypothetical protein
LAGDVDGLSPLAKAVYVLSLTKVGLFLPIPSRSLPFKDDNLPLFNRLSGRSAEGVAGDLRTNILIFTGTFHVNENIMNGMGT